MKKQNWKIGLAISLGISLTAAVPRLIRAERFDIAATSISIAYNFIFCISCWFVYQYLFNKTDLLRIRKWRLPLLAIIIIAVGCITFLYDHLLPLNSDNPLFPRPFPEIDGSKRPVVLLLRSSVISCLFYFIAYYLNMMAERQQVMLEVAQLKQAQLAASLSSLKEQLSPHFLFNTLNTLSSLTKEQPVKDYVAELADVYRYMLQYKEMDTATLRQELGFIQSYLYIIKTRLEDAIDVIIRVDDTVLDSRIPPLTLQLLIENAVKHNIASSTRQLKIHIRNAGEDFLEVSNNFQPKSSVRLSTGIGLENVMQRYRLLFNREIVIEQAQDFFIVKLPIV